MKESTYFDESEPFYKVLNFAMYNITELKKGFYESIFTSEYEALEDNDKHMVVGVIIGEYGFEDIKDFIDTCISEREKR